MSRFSLSNQQLMGLSTELRNSIAREAVKTYNCSRVTSQRRGCCPESWAEKMVEWARNPKGEKRTSSFPLICEQRDSAFALCLLPAKNQTKQKNTWMVGNNFYPLLHIIYSRASTTIYLYYRSLERPQLRVGSLCSVLYKHTG